MSSVKIINDDAIEVLKQLNDECIDLIVTDRLTKLLREVVLGIAVE